MMLIIERAKLNMMKFFEKLLAVVVFGLLAILMGSLEGCNVASSATDKQVSTLSSEPYVRSVSISPKTFSLTSLNEYTSGDTIDVSVDAIGSNNSAVSCSVSLQYLDIGSKTFSDVPGGTVSSCSNIEFNLNLGAGDYKLLAKVTDGNSKTVEVQKFLKVRPDPNHPYLQASFTVTPDSNFLEINLDATKSQTGATGEIVTYQWQIRQKFDDGTNAAVSTLTESAPKTSVVLNNDGIYVVQLTVTDQGGKTSTSTRQLNVSSGNSLIVVFDATVTSSIGSTNPAGSFPADINVAISNTSNITAGVDHYIWRMFDSKGQVVPIGDLNYVQTESPTAILPAFKSDDYLIQVKVVDKTGNEHTFSRIVHVQ